MENQHVVHTPPKLPETKKLTWTTTKNGQISLY